MKKLVIIGASGFGREVAWIVERINKSKPTWNLLGFIDDNEELLENMIDDYPVVGNCDWLIRQKTEIYAVCAIGSSRVRKQIIQKLPGVNFVTIIDPSVMMSEHVLIGEGSVICAGTIITVDIKIGSHVIINLNCTIGHDSNIFDFVTLYPSVNISGNTELNECIEIGTGSQILQGIRIGRGTIVGAGAVVVKDLPNECTAVGIPAKPIKFHNE